MAPADTRPFCPPISAHGPDPPDNSPVTDAAVSVVSAPTSATSVMSARTSEPAASAASADSANPAASIGSAACGSSTGSGP